MTTVKLAPAALRRARLDAFSNALTGLGVKGRDKRMAGAIARTVRLSYLDLDTWYTGDAIFAKIVDTLPEDMTREGVELTITDRPDDAKAIADRLDELDAMAVYDWALKLARIHGGAVVLLGINDGEDLHKPVNRDRITAINYLMPLDRWQITPMLDRPVTDHTSPHFGKPEFYQIAAGASGFASGAIVHHTRLHRFDGVRLTDREARRNNGWGDTIGTRLFNAIRAYHTAHDAASTIVDDFTQAVYKLKGLAEMLAGDSEEDQGGAEALTIRMRNLDQSRSLVRALVMDEDEEFSKLSTNVSGLDKLLTSTERRLTAESGMPHTKLLGESPGASLGEGGTDQERNWYDFVATRQDKILRRPVRDLVELLMLETIKTIPDEWALVFKSLWQLDDKEAAELRRIQSETDERYFRIGSLHAEEIARNRFRAEGYSTETTLDEKLRGELDEDPAEGLEPEDGDDEPPAIAEGDEPDDEEV